MSAQISKQATPTATERLADFALGLRYDDLPSDVVERVKALFLDFLGVACGGRAFADSSLPVLAAVRELCGDARSQTTRSDGGGGATVVGEEMLFPPQYAALLNGTFAHSMDFDDTHRESVTHPGTPVFAALLALGEATGARGSEFIAASAAGYEVSCRVGKGHGEGVHRRGFHPSATTGILGATAACARLLGLKREPLLNAWGLNLSMAAGTMQFLANGAWNKRVQVGLAAHNAIVALGMARGGVVGAADPIEGRFGYYRCYAEGGGDLPSALAGLGQEFEVMHTAVKPYPCCRYNHGIIDAVLALMRQYGISALDVADLEIGLNRVGLDVVAVPEEPKKAPQNVVDGQFSAYFAAAIALLEGRYTWECYRRLRDPEVLELMARMRAVEVDIPLLGARVTATTQSGQRLALEVPLARGEPESFLAWEDLLAKVRPLMQSALPDSQVAPLIDAVGRLETADSITSLARYLRPGGVR